MRVLIACEFSGVVRDAFAARGHDAWSCDLLPSESPGQHLQGDVRNVLSRGWDLMIAHPPCTYLARSGARWRNDPGRPELAEIAVDFVRVLADASIPRIAIENPVGLLNSAWRHPDQTIQPWMFGEGETKATCLWLKNLPLLRATRIADEREARVHRTPPSADRWKIRSRTLDGIAVAMADQWGNDDVTDLGIVGAGPSLLAVGALTVDELKAEAVTLKMAIDSSERRTREWRIRLGEVLTEIRAREGHGNWLPYVGEQLAIGDRQAERYMLLARNSTRVSNLPAGLSMREELAALRQPTEPKPLPEQPAEGDAVEAPTTTLLRFMPPGAPTYTIVDAILSTCFPDASDVLDVTYGSGAFWDNTKPSRLRIRAHDLDEARAPHGVMDFRRLDYDDASSDVVLFDPPHLADGGDESVMTGRFGTALTQEAIDSAIIDGAREAWRVCRLGIVCKVTDHVHARVFQQETMLLAEALEWIRPYDVVHQVRDHAFIDPSWNETLSARNNGSTFVIYRKGSQIHQPRRPE